MRHLDSESGFTLVELIITATFVAAASAAIIGIFITVNKLNKQSRNLAVVTGIAEQKIESYRNGAYSAIPTGTPAEDFTSSLPTNLGSPKSATTNISESTAGLKTVDVIITWKEDGLTKNVRLSTVVAQRGIDR